MQISYNSWSQSFWSFFDTFLSSLMQDPIFRYAKKKILKFFAICNRNVSFEWNLMKKDLGTIEVKIKAHMRNFKGDNTLAFYNFRHPLVT